MVHKTWDGGKDQNCSQDYKTFPLLTTSKSVIINDSQGAKKTCISVIGDHPGFDSDRWQIFEKVSSPCPASSPIPVTIRREYITGNAKINQLDLINPIYISRFATVDNDKCEPSRNFVKLRQGSGEDRQGMALKAKGLNSLH